MTPTIYPLLYSWLTATLKTHDCILPLPAASGEKTITGLTAIHGQICTARKTSNFFFLSPWKLAYSYLVVNNHFFEQFQKNNVCRCLVERMIIMRIVLVSLMALFCGTFFFYWHVILHHIVIFTSVKTSLKSLYKHLSSGSQYLLKLGIRQKRLNKISLVCGFFFIFFVFFF